MSGDPTANEFRSRSWPIWLFVAVSLLLNLSLPGLIEWVSFRDFERQILAFICFAGVLAGQCSFVVLVAGLTKRTWLGAYLFGLGFAAAGYTAVVGGFLAIGEFERESIAGVALLPAFLLVAASPLYGLRHFGWRLAVEGEPPPARQRVLLADIFSLIAIVAAVIVLARVPQVISETDPQEFWFPVLITCLILFGTSLVLVPLHTRVALGGLALPRKLAWMMIFALLIVAICFGIGQCFYSLDTRWRVRVAILPFLLAFIGSAIGVFYLSLLLLAASGRRLERGRELKHGPQSDDNRQHAARLKRLTWWRIGGAIAVTMATSIYLANLQQWRGIRDEENATLRRRAVAIDAELNIVDRIPYYLALGTKATDDSLAQFAICNELEYLLLKNSPITDDGLAQLRHFPSLHTLSLENMSLSDEGLVHLRHLPNLETLEIVNCRVKGSHIAGLPNKRRLTTLKLTRTQFGDVECACLAEFSKLRSLTLDHTRITDHSVATIGRLKTLTTLELVGTELVAERFPFLPQLQHLDLSRTRANDATVSAIARLDQLQYLSLRDTKVTNASIPSLTPLQHLYHVDLSDNLVDDEGIREIGREIPLVSIDLSCTQVTGTGFDDWQSNTRYHAVILDRTLADDKGIAALTSISEVDDLSLAHTEVTDACLTHLDQITIGELDIRATQITFGGLLANGLPSVGTLRVAPGQFTSQQIFQLEQQLAVKVRFTKTRAPKSHD